MKKRHKSTDTVEHYNAIMIEDLHSKIELVIEGLEVLRSEFRREISSFRNEVNGRFDVVEAAIRSHSHEIRNLHSKIDRAGRNKKSPCISKKRDRSHH